MASMMFSYKIARCYCHPSHPRNWILGFHGFLVITIFHVRACMQPNTVLYDHNNLSQDFFKKCIHPHSSTCLSLQWTLGTSTLSCISPASTGTGKYNYVVMHTCIHASLLHYFMMLYRLRCPLMKL